MIRSLLTFIVILATAFSGFACRMPDVFDDLDCQINNRFEYLDGRQAGIDSLEHQWLKNPIDTALTLRLAKAFIGFDNDSALVYLTRGINISAGVDKMRFTWLRSSLLPLAGFFQKAEDDFLSIVPDSVPLCLLPSYYDSGRKLYSYLSDFFESYSGAREEYMSQALDFQRKLLDVLPKNSVEFKFCLGEYYFLTGSNIRARVLLQEILDTPGGEKFSAKAAYYLSYIARNAGEEDLYDYYLALSAIADIKSATRGVAPLLELGIEMQAIGDMARAHRYLSVAVENAKECGAPLRMIESLKALPVIENAHEAHVVSLQRYICWLLVCVAVLLIGLTAVLFLLRREIKMRSAIQLRLNTEICSKKVYISYFLELCSIYMDKLNEICRISTRKIAAGQTDELFRMVKSGKFVEDHSKEFYQVFDNTFLHIYPDFVEGVNALLLPEEKIVLKDGEKMNTDLRILAVMRLGVEESSKIAQVLNYSLNTIYAYRNRLKSRAINRESFEADIMKIGSNA